MAENENPVYRFGGFELDPAERRLLGHGQPITLTPKVFDTLVLLVERAGHAVSKDELMSALWPRGFVDESNLTKHIWLIRKALGEGELDARFIETVPKLGYRFMAAVARGAPVADAPALNLAVPARDVAQPSPADTSEVSVAMPLPPATEPPRRLRRRFAAALIVAVILAVAFAWYTGVHQPELLSSAEPTGGAIAIVDFNNLSQNPKDAWLGPALSEMLATELAVGGKVHALPDELVRPARSGLSAPLAGGYAASSLATLRKRLGAQYVLSGSYLVSGASEDAKLRLDLALQDARSGAAIANLSRSGTVAELSALVTQGGAMLREHLGLAPASAVDLASTASAQPPTADVARRIGFALDALHRNDPARARDELLDAVAQAPGYAPAYSYLAQAWSALGYKAKARAAIEQAAAHIEGLPQEQRLLIQAQLYSAQFDWPKAVQAQRGLLAAYPNNVEYAFQLIDVLLAASKPAEADTALAELRKKADAIGNDPRVDLAAARVAAARSDSKAQADYARRALQQAQARDAPGLIADARLQLGIARDYLAGVDDAGALLRQAVADYQHIGNPHGEAYAHVNLANLLVDLNQVQGAREEYQRAMATYQQIGDQDGVAKVYQDLCRLLWNAGDRDGAETAARRSLEIRRATGDLRGQAWDLTALATLDSDEAASDEVLDEYRQAIAIDEQAEDHSHHAFALLTYSDVLRARGELQAAQDACTQASSEAEALTERSSFMLATFQCALVAVDRGEIDSAKSGFAHAQQLANEIGDLYTLANGELSLAQIDMGRQQWATARDRLQRAIDGFSKAELPTGEAVAQSFVSLCYQALGDTVARDRAAARARELRSRITERQEVFAVDIGLAELRGQSGDRVASVAALRELAADAGKRHWLSQALEAKLAAWRVLKDGRSPDADALERELQAEAKSHGFRWVIERLQGAASAPATAQQ